MPELQSNYSEFFTVDESYYPEINPDSIKGDIDGWMKTWPHPTFIELLEKTERMLAREARGKKHASGCKVLLAQVSLELSGQLRNCSAAPKKSLMIILMNFLHCERKLICAKSFWHTSREKSSPPFAIALVTLAIPVN